VYDVASGLDPRKLPPPQQLATNMWPLFAMWPILYAATQVEHMLGLVPP